jgi:anti-anti-sigma factor
MVRRFERHPFRVEVETLDDDVALLSVVGEADMATVPRVEAAADTAFYAGTGTLVIDLLECDFLDSTGLRFLLAARGRFTTVALVPPSEGPVAKLLALTVNGLFNTFTTREAAVDAVSSKLAA